MVEIVNGVTLQPTAGQVFATRAAAVTPGSTPLADVTRYIYVGVTGNLVVIMADDASQTPITFTAVPAGTLLPIAVSFVTAASTATSIVALF